MRALFNNLTPASGTAGKLNDTYQTTEKSQRKVARIKNDVVTTACTFMICLLAALPFSAIADNPPASLQAVDNSDRKPLKERVREARIAEGKKLYEQVCYECHNTGFNGAPRLGVKEDWKEISRYGKVALLESVIVGKGLMPRQGGSADESESRYRLMVEYMLSTVGADHIETTQETWDEATLARHLSNGKALYNMVCADCHATGANGAPPITDHAAWAPRAAKGIDSLVQSVLKGHGNMLPLGGSAINSIDGVREMIAFMLNTAGFKPRQQDLEPAINPTP